MLSKKYIEKHLEAIIVNTEKFFCSSDEEIEQSVTEIEKQWVKRPQSWKNGFKLGDKNEF